MRYAKILPAPDLCTCLLLLFTWLKCLLLFSCRFLNFDGQFVSDKTEKVVHFWIKNATFVSI